MNNATNEPGRMTNSTPLFSSATPIAHGRISVDPVDNDERVHDPLASDRNNRTEYNLFRPAVREGHDQSSFIAIEDAEREWIASMDAQGWPILPDSTFNRYVWFGGERELHVPVRYSVPPASEPSEFAVAA